MKGWPGWWPQVRDDDDDDDNDDDEEEEEADAVCVACLCRTTTARSQERGRVIKPVLSALECCVCYCTSL